MKTKLKRKETQNISIKLDGYEAYDNELKRKFNAWYIGNILLSGLIGGVVDAITGSIYNLSPKKIDVVLIKEATTEIIVEE